MHENYLEIKLNVWKILICLLYYNDNNIIIVVIFIILFMYSECVHCMLVDVMPFLLIKLWNW